MISPSDQDRPFKQHLDYIDTVRGIAALCVMVYHFINWRYEDRLAAKIASIVFNGSDAVSFFFVLSGFALSYPYIVLNRPIDIKTFYINRIFRLWPAFFITVALNALNWNRYNLDFHSLKDLFVLNKTHFWEEALLLRTYAQYYTPGWTLVIELSISFFMPFMILLAKKSQQIVLWLLFAFLFIGGNMGGYYLFHFHFALGVLLSCFFYQLQQASFLQTRWYRYRYLIIGLSILLYSIRHLERIFPFGPTYTSIAKYVGIDFFHYTGLASCVFIAAILYSRKIQTILAHRFLRFFGKISYGIYLMHWLLVTDVFIYWNKLASYFPTARLAFFFIFFAYSGITILLATALHYAIELPFIRSGKRVTQRLKPTTYS